MQDLLSLGRSGLDLLLVIVGFGFIIFVHELGHFLAAKWAGIRVLGFAIGFGPAVLSFRKGMGLRLGSSAQAYEERLKGPGGAEAARRLSPTEYRLNWLPLGGYVKMLGQEDLNPGAVSGDRDSYQNTRVWKRMVVISAGVVMNVILAAMLFVVVFMTGLKTEPPKIGAVHPDSPAAVAGLRPGDEVVEVNGRRPQEFTDLVLAAAMSGRGDTVRLAVRRPGEDLVRLEVKPRESELSRLMEMGVEPARGTALLDSRRETERAQIAARLAQIGLEGVGPGMTLVRIGDDAEVRTPAELIEAVERSGGAPVEVEFAGGAGEDEVRVRGTIVPRPALQQGWVMMPAAGRDEGTVVPVPHLLGLMPVMQVAPDPQGTTDRKGLEDGDIFARVGSVEFPGLSQGIAEIQRHRGERIPVGVLRGDAGEGGRRFVEIEPAPLVEKEGKGRIGFVATDTGETDTLVALPIAVAESPEAARSGLARPTPASSVITRPGTRVLSVDGRPVGNFGEMRAALREATRRALETGAASATVTLELELPLPPQNGRLPVESRRWTIESSDIRELHGLGWSSPLSLYDFVPESYELKADGPLHAIRMGLQKTQRVMAMTYLTFARLIEGTVKVEHLKGPVGIAHMGTRIAERGLVWMLFFMALISVNLAVINFLPLPIVDGGQFIFLVLEQVRGKPVSIEVQNLATIVGMVLIGTVFIIVTFNDIAGLFAG